MNKNQFLGRIGFISFCKKEFVFCTALVAALISTFFVPPSSTYFTYIDWNVLCMLFSLMLVVAGLQSCGVFSFCADFLCARVHSLRLLSGTLIFLCFIFSMFVTNDVSLITFVPFAILMLARTGHSDKTVLVVVLQTIAANLGSMLTPMGNPQNIFLYNKMQMNPIAFCAILLPYTIASAIVLFVCLLFIPNIPLKTGGAGKSASAGRIRSYSTAVNRQKALWFYFLFILCLCAVFKLIPAPLLALIVISISFLIDRKLPTKIDYLLLLTFCAFFIFTGNIRNISGLGSFLEHAVRKHEFLFGLAASQIISNVPAALLLYPFSYDIPSLLLGVDIGGLGTPVASLASLISFRLYTNSTEIKKDRIDKKSNTISGKRYLIIFSIVNLLFLIVLCGLYTVLVK